ncbi:hypothetical protein [Anaeromyxobacter paludicola]|uniref:Lipoprotein n=1 Tax=Anaeromyxobacter paludicola TaxID=2918171 RepID=A0ABM7XDU2_9BACT|nr:hypothetical protein [Anaeromyxobacter paludicola]BDG10040.1 hypothetical protein AMPC_31530 [Anaeromyxobacter paludicola]
MKLVLPATAAVAFASMAGCVTTRPAPVVYPESYPYCGPGEQCQAPYECPPGQPCPPYEYAPEEYLGPVAPYGTPEEYGRGPRGEDEERWEHREGARDDPRARPAPPRADRDHRERGEPAGEPGRGREDREERSGR